MIWMTCEVWAKSVLKLSPQTELYGFVDTVNNSTDLHFVFITYSKLFINAWTLTLVDEVY